MRELRPVGVRRPTLMVSAVVMMPFGSTVVVAPGPVRASENDVATDATDGMEHLEQVRLHHQRVVDPADDRCAGPAAGWRRWLPRRLPAQHGTGVRHLRGAGGQRLRAVLQQRPGGNRQPGARGAGRPSVRRLRLDCLKYDWCSPKDTINDQVAAFAEMRDALAATGRPSSTASTSTAATPEPARRNRGGVANLWRATECITSVGGNAEHPAERRLLFNQGSSTAIVGTTAGAIGKTGASFTPAHGTAVFPSAEAAPSHRHPT